MGPQKEPNNYDKQLVALGRILQTLREEENVDVLIETVINYLQTEFDYSLIWIGLYDRLDHRIIGKGGATPNGEDAMFLQQRFPLTSGDVLEQVVIQQRPLGLPDLREETRAGDWRRIAQKFNIQGTVIFPIRYKDRCFGVTLLGSRLWGVSPRSDEKARLSMILGGLAAALYQIEVDWQRQQTKRPEKPLFALLSRLRSLPSLGQRLEAIVEETHQFINPSRTNIYWFERQRRYFWRRVSNRQRTTGFGEGQAASGITAQEVSSFYQALAADQVVSIGEAHSSLKADTTARLMQQIRARSLLAAPIHFQNELLGFLAVEGSEARIWAEEEKNYVRSAAQLIALIAPLDEMEATVQQTKLDQALTAEITRAIYTEADWQATLKNAAEQLSQRLNMERFLILLYDTDQHQFDICYQNHPPNRRAIAGPLQVPNDVDWQLLERSTEAVGIENLDDDLKLVVWRDILLETGVRSLLVCSTGIGQPLEGVIMLCHEATRTWNRAERELVRVVAQQIGLILHQWQLQRQSEQQQKLYQTIQWGLTTIQQTPDLDRLERSALQHLTQVLQAPLAVLVTWLPGRREGALILPPLAGDRFALNPHITVPVYTDVLVQWAIESKEMLRLAVEDVPAESRKWLSAPGIGQLLVLALRTAPEHEPTGIVIVADGPERRWVDRHLSAFSSLVTQLAWSRRYLLLVQMLESQREDLERLNWYKQRRMEDMYRAVGLGMRRLNELVNQKDALTTTRQQQILRQLGDAMAAITPVIREEQWQLRTNQATIPLISLLRRSLERADSLIKQRQLWSQVHNESNLTISGDIVKIELVIYELLMAACQRSQAGGRIDLWCRQIDNRWFELSITDSGIVEPRLISDLQAGRAVDLLAPSALDQPPGLHLLVCQAVMQQIGGEFQLMKLEDGRVLSRLILALANDRTASVRTDIQS